jgi:1-acyl-sn-glycerol-3-phosphate acyltransferase
LKLWWFIGPALAVLVAGAVRALDRAHVADWGGYGINLLDGLNRAFCRRFHRLVVEPIRLPAQGGALIVSNHTSGLDPLLIVAACSRPVRFLIAQEEYDRWWLRWFFRWIGCIPVDRSARGARAFYSARDELERGEVLCLFPQARIRKPGEPPLPLNRGFLVLAEAAAVPVVPVRISGIAGAGMTLSAVLRRSRARLESGMPESLPGRDAEAVLERIDGFLQPPG